MIVVVDDNPDVQRVMVRLLNVQGYEAIALPSATAMLEFLKSNMPSLLILDYSMPEMDGLTLFQEIRRNPRFSAIPVLMFSAHGDPLKSQAIAAGVDGYIVKGSLDWARFPGELARLIGPGKKMHTTVSDSREQREKNAG